MKLIVNGHEKEVTIRHQGHQEVSFSLNGTTYSYRPNLSDRPFEIALEREQSNYHFYWHQTGGVIDGWDVTVQEALPTQNRRIPSDDGNDDEILSPMPGKILQVNVSPGNSVKKGEVLAVIEAMKMEHTLKAPRNGVIATIHWKPGDTVEGGAVLAKLEKIP